MALYAAWYLGLMFSLPTGYESLVFHLASHWTVGIIHIQLMVRGRAGVRVRARVRATEGSIFNSGELAVGIGSVSGLQVRVKVTS